MSLSDIRAGFAHALVPIDSLRFSAEWPDDFNLPSLPNAWAALQGPVSSDYEKDLGGCHVGHLFELTVAVSVSGGQARAQRALDALLDAHGPSSINEALLADGTLGGAVHALWNRGLREYGKLHLLQNDGITGVPCYGFVQMWEVFA